MTTYLVHRSDNATSAAQAARAFLESRPIEHNLILTLLRERIERPAPGRYWWVTESGVVRGVALRSPLAFKATVTPMPLDAVGALVDAVAADAPDLPGVSGEAATAATFAGAWTERRSSGAHPGEGQRIYRLDAARSPGGVPGSLRVADREDLERLSVWFVAFQQTVGGNPPVDDVAGFLAGPVAERRFWVWEHDGEPVAATMISSPIAGAARISFVFTPPERRSNGYATAMVAELCARALAPDRPFGRVEACLLYTQLHNATSNAIYRRIGFRAAAEVTVYEFDPP